MGNRYEDATGLLAPYCVALVSFICGAGTTLRHSASQGQDGPDTALGNGAATGVSGVSEAAAVIYLLRRGYIFADCFTHPQAGVSERRHCGDQVHHET